MKYSNKLSKLKHHLEGKIYCKIFRKAGNSIIHNEGYIVDFNEDFVVFQESDDFELKGYVIITTRSIKAIRFNDTDAYYHEVMRAEEITDLIDYTHKIDLTNWATIFQSIKDSGFNVIIENERPGKETFDIGPIVKVKNKSVEIRYFNATGYLSEKLTKFKWKDMTIVKFDDRYINVFSKYLRS